MPVETYDKRGDCCHRFPRADEVIHPDLATDPLAEPVWKHVGFRVEAMLELIAEDCPADLTKTIYYRCEKPLWKVDGAFLEHLRYKQHVGRLTRDTGYDVLGWPVVRRLLSGQIGFQEGTHRLATLRALGRPAAAILIERPDYKNNRFADAIALQ